MTAAKTEKYRCQEPTCRKNVAAVGADNRYRKHTKEGGEECPRSRTIIPAWLIRRGPEEHDSDVPAEGRDYATCPDCGQKPRLDDEGCFVQHSRPSPEGPELCLKSGEPYAAPKEESECPEDTRESATAAPPATPAAADSPDSGGPAAPTVTKEPVPISRERLAQADQDAEGLISKWASEAKRIEDGKSSPESTPTPPDSPPPQATSPAPDGSSVPPSGATSSASPSTAAASTTATPSPVTQDWRSRVMAGQGEAPPPPASAPEDAPADIPPTCHMAQDHEPHEYLSGRKRTPCPGKGTQAAAPETAPTASAPEIPGAAAAAPASAPALMNSMPTAPPPPPSLAGPSPAAPTPEEPAAAEPDDRWPQFKQPGSPFSQPAAVAVAEREEEVPMTVLAEKVAAGMKQLFFHYNNRKTADNRAAQTTLGPSEIGTPCDRRLAMSLLDIPAVNPGGDNWAAFVGTAIHAALADMFTWADGGTGRYAVEQRLEFPSEFVPRGTADLLDRTLFMVDDHKAMGRYSLDKLKTQGIPIGYRVQLNTYGLGERAKGERVDYVALIAWPREASSLDDLYVVVERYDPQIARDALARVDRIAAATEALDRGEPLKTAREFAVDPESCKFCPFHAPNDPEMSRGCPGRQ